MKDSETRMMQQFAATELREVPDQDNASGHVHGFDDAHYHEVQV